MGPEEPHAASTTWPDGVTEKSGLDTVDTEAERIEFENFLRFEIPSHPKLHRGQLKNGLRYLILPNKVPPNRYSSFSNFNTLMVMINAFLGDSGVYYHIIEECFKHDFFYFCAGI